MNTAFHQDIHQLILNEAVAGYWDCSLQDGEHYLSPSFKSLLGYENEPLENYSDLLNTIIWKDDQVTVLKNLQAHVNNEDEVPFRGEVRLKLKNGTPLWTMYSGKVTEWSDNHKPLRVVGCTINITDHKNTRQELETSENRFRGAFEHSAIGMALVSLEGQILKVNERCCKIFGYSREELPAFTFQELTYPDDLEKDLSQLERLLNDEISSYQLEKRYVHKNGEIIWAMLSVSLVRTPDGEPVHFVSQIEDITERKQNAHELEKTLQVVQQQNDRLLNFAHIVSHNLRTHASNLDRMLHFYKLEQNPSEKGELMGYLEQISDGFSETLQHLSGITKSEIDTHHTKEQLSLYNYAVRALSTLQTDLIQTKAEIQNLIPQDITVNFNPAYLDSIFLNLLSNALKYRKEDQAPQITLSVAREADFYVLKITDNGQGIDMEKYGDQLFGLYRTFHNHEKSQGVGLYITRNQVEAMDGKIEAKSSPGNGATFKVYIKKE